MKLSEVNTGDLVVVSDAPDATIYRVGQIGHPGSRFAVELIDDSGYVSRTTGYRDVNILRTPTAEQLDN